VRESSDAVAIFAATLSGASEPLSCEAVRTLAADRYCIEAVPERLTGERDQNFRLSAEDGSEYLLKIDQQHRARS
jgi:hydroxylysine kinase